MTEDLKLRTAGGCWVLSILSTLNKNYDRREFCRLRKIFVSSGKGGKGSTHLHREFIEKVDRMVVMEVVVDMFSECKVWTLFHLLNLLDISKREVVVMEVVTVQERMVRQD
jgi:hypothetical protein